MENLIKLQASVDDMLAKFKAKSEKDEVIAKDIETLKAMKGEIEGFNAKIEEKESAIEDLETKLKAMKQKVTNIEKREESVKAAMNAVGVKLREPEMAEKLNDLSASLKAGKKGSLDFKIKAADMNIGTNIGDNPAVPAVNPYRRNEPVDVRRKGREVYDSINTVQIDTSTVYEDYEAADSGTPVFAADDAAAPDLDVTFATEAFTTKRISGYTGVSDKMLRVVSYIENKIESIIRRKLIVGVTTQMIEGDGTGNNLYGLKTLGTAFSLAGTGLTAGDLGVLTSKSKVEILGAAMLQAQRAFFNPDTKLISHGDVLGMKLRKDDNGSFDGAIQTAEALQGAIPNQYIGSDEFIVFDSSIVTKYIQQDITVTMGYIDDMFIKSQTAIKVEMDMAQVVNPNEAEGIVYGTYTAAATALNA